MARLSGERGKASLRLCDPLSRTKGSTNKFRIVHSFEKCSKLPPARPMSPGGERREERTRPWRVYNRARISHSRTRLGHGAWLQAKSMSGHGLNELGQRQGASRRGAHSSFRLPLRNQPLSKKNDHGEYQLLFILIFSPTFAFFHTKETLHWCEFLVWDNSPPRTLEVGSIG